MSRQKQWVGKGSSRLMESSKVRRGTHSWSEPLERRVLLAAAVNDVSPATYWEPDPESLVKVTATATAQPLEGSEVTPSVVNGVVYSNMGQGTGFGAFGPATGLLGVEDYDSINNANITLTELQFVGGVSAAGGALDFEFYNTSDVFVTGFSVSLGSAGNFLWTIGPISGVTVPDAGFLRVRAQPGTTGQWLFSNAAPTIGTQSSGLGNAPAGNSFKSELTNTSPNQPPVITSLSDSPDPVAAGATVTLTANGVSDPDGTVSNVKFYRESNGNPGLQAASDLLLSTDSASPFSASVTAPAANGVNTYYAQATDNGGMDGNVVSTTNTVGAGSISGTVWNDANNNKLFDGGEAVLSGWTVFLDQDKDQVLDAGEVSTTTNGSGNYTFNGLATDTYFITTVIPAGWQQTFPGATGQISATPVGDIQARPNPLPPAITTTASAQPVYLSDGASAAPTSGEISISDAQSNPLIRLTNFQADPRFNTIRGQNSSVAVLDTGIDLNHPFFGPDVAAPFGVADRIVYNRDFADNDMDASDVNGHGTNVASIVGSQDPTHGGMAPNVNIIALKVFTNAGAGNFAYVEAALQWCVANAAAYNLTAINMSLGDNNNFNTNQTLYGINDELAALAAMNVMVVSAAGNDFAKFVSAQGVSYPAADPNSLAVSAVYDANLGQLTWGVSPNQSTDFTTGPDRITSFSQRSALQTDIMAPGAIITGGNQSGGTVNQGGTSQASPHIAGIAALAQQLAVRDLGRKLTMAEFKTLMNTSGVTINDGDDENDSVVNTGANFKRVDVLALGEAIRALAIAPFSHTVTLSAGENAGGVNFGNRASDAVAPTADIVDIAPDPRQSAAGLVTINFSEAVTGVGVSDFQLTRDGGVVSLAGAVFNQVNPSQYTIDLSTVTGAAGAYALQLTALGSGIQDAASNLLAADSTDAWIMNAVNGAAGADTITLRRSGGGSNIEVIVNANPAYLVNIAGLGANPLHVLGAGGDDVVTMDFLNGAFSPTGGITLDGGASSAGDLLVLKGTGASETATFNTASFSFGATPITYSGTEKFRFDGGNGGDTLNVNAGTYAFDTDASPATAALTVNVAAAATVNFNSTQHLDGLNIVGNAAISAGGSKVLVTKALAVTGTGKLDLRDNDLVVNYSAVSPIGTFSGGSYNGISGLLDIGRGAAANAVWNGNGIVTSDARAIGTSNRTLLGFAEASQALGLSGTQTGTFAGEVVDATAVLVKFSWGGDATLDGKINIDDYGRIDANVASSGSVFGWYNGDFNYDGSINIDDYGIIDGTISQQTGDL